MNRAFAFIAASSIVCAFMGPAMAAAPAKVTLPMRPGTYVTGSTNCAGAMSGDDSLDLVALWVHGNVFRYVDIEEQVLSVKKLSANTYDLTIRSQFDDMPAKKYVTTITLGADGGFTEGKGRSLSKFRFCSPKGPKGWE